MTSIEGSTFSGCTSLRSVTIPQGVSRIRDLAFMGCTALTAAAVPQGVTSLGNHTFRDCWALTNVLLPSSLLSIGAGAFASCWRLPHLTIPPRVTRIETNVFIDCAGLRTVDLPEGIVSIDDSAFEFCGSLTSIAIPSTVTALGTHAFSFCSALKSVYFLGNAPNMGANLFLGTHPQIALYFFHGNTGFSMPTWLGLPTVELSGSAPVTGWLVSNGIQPGTPLDSDPNGDRIPLLLAYALNLDPNRDLNGSMPQPVLANGQLSLSFHGNRSDINYAVETSTNLQAWTTAVVTLSQPDGNGIRIATVGIGGENRFMRLSVRR